MTKVLVINGSPNMVKSNTAFLLNPFMEGMNKAGASIELFYSNKLNILPCIGCFKCWRETIGECFIQDDMQKLYPKLWDTDILILATPVYSPLPGGIQNFINRLVPLIEPLLEFRDGRTRAKCHDNVKISKILAVVVGGWYEIENLELAVKLIEELSETYSIEYSGAVLRPHAYSLKSDTEKSKEILHKLEEVGFKFIKEGLLSKEDLDFISQPLVDEKKIRERANSNYLKRKNQS